MNRVELLEKITAVAADMGLIDETRVLAESEPFTALGIDEIDIIEIVDELEEEIDYDIPDDALDDPPTTIGGLLDLFQGAFEED